MIYSPELYIHDLDRKAFDALKAFPKFVDIWETYVANYDEKAVRIELMSSYVKLSDKQMPEIYDLLPPICEKLGIAIPELYYIKSKEINAATTGTAQPCIMITSKLVEELSREMISSVLAHECGHIACKHTLYQSMAQKAVEGINKISMILGPVISRYLSPALFNALYFWDRCSELSADRAAVLCDGNAEKTVDTLLKVHGYGSDIDRDEFLKQAMDLREFVNDSKSNKLLEQMLMQGESHPRLATRAYECYDWSKSEQYRGIIDGTYTIEKKQKEEKSEIEIEIVSGEATVETKNSIMKKADIDDINKNLDQVNRELERYTNNADKTDYAFAVCSGILSGMIDACFVGKITITGSEIDLSHKHVNNFIQEYAKARGFEGKHLEDAIGDLEKAFKVAQDNVWKGKGISVSAKNHHLADLAHHPTPVGLMASLIVRFLHVGTFVNKEGEWRFIIAEARDEEIKEIFIAAALSGIFNWIAGAAEKKCEADSEREIPKALHCLLHLAASTPILIEVAKCADNWFGHLVSDMGGSKNTAGGGMGIPGVFISFLYEIAALPGLKDSGLPKFLNELYEKQKLDLRHELQLYKAAGKQVVPVVFNELCVRVGYFVFHLVKEMTQDNGINWNNVIPVGNRTVDRMLAISNMTFSIADTADAAVHAAIESGGNWVLFSGRFVSRFNYVGMGRAALAIVKEISNEKKEAQLIHEKMLLSEKKSLIFMQQLQDFKMQLEEKVSNYLAEDIESFMAGFEFMEKGLEEGDSNLVIKGNVIIQKVLGREPQFMNQEEFDELMESSVSLQL